MTIWTELICLNRGMIAMQVTHDVYLQVRKLLESRVGVILGCANDTSA